MKQRITLTILLVGLLANSLCAQDVIKAEFNKQDPVYYNNEEMRFNISTDPRLFEAESNVICKLDFKDTKGVSVLSKMLYLTKNSFSTQITVPDNMKTGLYMVYFSLVDKKHWAIKPYATEVKIINLKHFSDQDVIQKDVSQGPAYDPDQKAEPLVIRGTVLQSNSPATDEPIVILQSRGQSGLYTYTRADDKGNFLFNNPIFGENELCLMVMGSADQSYSIRIDQFPYDQIEDGLDIFPYPLPKESLNEDSLRANIIKYNYKAVKSAKRKDVIGSLNFSKRVVVDEYAALPTTMDVLREIVPLKKVKRVNKKPQIHLLNTVTNSYFKDPPMYLIDGFIVEDFEEVISQNPEDLETLDISYSPVANFSSLGRFAKSGVISINTKQGGYKPKGVKVIAFQGLLKSI